MHLVTLEETLGKPITEIMATYSGLYGSKKSELYYGRDYWMITRFNT